MSGTGGHRHLQPVERDCICLTRLEGEAHTAQCNASFRAKFFSLWRAERLLFYGT